MSEQTTTTTTNQLRTANVLQDVREAQRGCHQRTLTEGHVRPWLARLRTAMRRAQSVSERGLPVRVTARLDGGGVAHAYSAKGTARTTVVVYEWECLDGSRQAPSRRVRVSRDPISGPSVAGASNLESARGGGRIVVETLGERTTY